MSEPRRQDIPAIAAAPSPAAPFATPEAGADYFATQEHYDSLARRTMAILRRRCRLVLVTGTISPNPLVFSSALTTAAGGSYRVIQTRCGPELSLGHVLLTTPEIAAEQPQLVPPTSSLFVFGEADRLSDAQLDAICDQMAKEKTKAAAVLFGGPTFLVRLESLKPGVLKHPLVANVGVQELGPEEIETFVRRQLRADLEASAFTAEAIGAIADFSGGNPALVNRLARLMIELADNPSTKCKDKIAGNGNIAKASAAEMVPSNERQDSNIGTTPDLALRAGEPNTGASSDLRSMHIALGGGSSPAHAEPGRQSSMPLNIRRAFPMLPTAFVLCVGAGGFAIIKSVSVSQLGQFAQQKIVAFAESDLGLPANIASSKKTDAATWIVDELTPESRAKHSLPVETGVEPDSPTSEQGTERENLAPGISAQQIPETLTHSAAPATNELLSTETSATAAGAVPKRQPDASPPGPAISTAAALPVSEAAALVARGDTFVRMRDITSARLFYERAAEAGDGHAASRMGSTFDAGFLERAGIPGAKADEQKALSWYKRARDLGDAEVDRLLKSLDPH